MSEQGKKSEQGESGYHVPVMLSEAIEALHIKDDGVYVDCTFGGGGHTRAIVEKLGRKGKIFAFDQDEAAKANVPYDPRVVFVPHNFRHITRMLKLHGVTRIDGLLADLGVSSWQFDKADRGFSIRYDADLDMRMDQRQTLTAAQLINERSERELHKIFEEYGEVTNAITLAKTITHYREGSKFQTISQFKDALQHVVKGNPNRYFAQVFQALRIAVNDEFGALKEMLEQTPGLLNPGGRLVLITFHSLEDRIAKSFIRNGTFNEIETDDIYGTRQETPFIVVSKKPILPSVEETRKNPRSRSAKLRVAERKT